MSRLILLVVALVACWLPQPAHAIDVRVDRRVEFAAAMCRLAGLEEYRGPGIADYDAAVDAHFGRFRDHPSIATRSSARPRGTRPAGCW